MPQISDPPTPPAPETNPKPPPRDRTPLPPSTKPRLVEGSSAPSEGEEPTEYQKKRRAFNAKASSTYLDPCQEAANRSLRCLARNQKDKELCNDYFQAYRDCKKRWIEERKEEKRKMGGWFY